MINRILLSAISTILAMGYCMASEIKFEGVNTLEQKIAQDVRNNRDELYVKEKMQGLISTRDDGIPSPIFNPKGYEKPYSKSVLGVDWGEPFQETSYTSIVFAEDNVVYIRDILLRAASMGFGSYVKGEIKDGFIKVPVPQTLIEYEGGWGRIVGLMEKDANGEWVSSDLSEITYSYNAETGVIKSELPGAPGEYAIAMKWSFDDTWNEIGDYLQVYTPYDGEFVTLPENVSLEEYYYNDGYYAYPVQVGIDGEDLYIRGLSQASESSVIKAKIEGNKGYIPQNELLGTVMGYFIWTKMMVPDPVLGWALVPADETYKLEVDLDHKVIKSADPEQILIFNCEYDRVFYLDGFNNFTISVQTSFAGTPQNPFGISFDGEEFREFYGIYGFNFNISNISKEGTILDTSNLYYSIYIDGDILEFEENEGLYGIMYPGVEGVVTRMPFDFINGYDIDASSQTGRFIGIYPDGVTTIGVQAIYEYDGVTTYSQLLTLNVETNEITAGMELVKSEDIASVKYFDLSGKTVSNPGKGLYIKQYILTDGRTVSKKVMIR